MKPLERYLSQRSALGKEGRLFVIIGRQTFSSGILNAVALKKAGAILIGEATGGKPNHYGEVKSFTLPNSNLDVTYSTKYFKMLSEDTPSLMPDIPAPLTMADYLKGINTPIDTAIRGR